MGFFARLFGRAQETTATPKTVASAKPEDAVLAGLRDLPLKALVVFAMRCVRRVQSFYVIAASEPGKQAFERVLVMGEEYAMGTGAYNNDEFTSQVDLAVKGLPAPGGVMAREPALSVEVLAKAAMTAIAAGSGESAAALSAAGATYTRCMVLLTQVQAELATVALLGTLKGASGSQDVATRVSLLAKELAGKPLEELDTIDTFEAVALKDVGRLACLSLGHFPEEGRPVPLRSHSSFAELWK